GPQHRALRVLQRALDVDPRDRRRRGGAAQREQFVGEQVLEALVAGGEEFHRQRLADAPGERDSPAHPAAAQRASPRGSVRITAAPAARRKTPPTPPRARPADANRLPAAAVHAGLAPSRPPAPPGSARRASRSEEHTSELQSRENL